MIDLRTIKKRKQAAASGVCRLLAIVLQSSLQYIYFISPEVCIIYTVQFEVSWSKPLANYRTITI